MALKKFMHSDNKNIRIINGHKIKVHNRVGAYPQHCLIGPAEARKNSTSFAPPNKKKKGPKGQRTRKEDPNTVVEESNKTRVR